MTFDFLDAGLILRFAINIVAMTVLVFGMFYMRTATRNWLPRRRCSTSCLRGPLDPRGG